MSKIAFLLFHFSLRLNGITSQNLHFLHLPLIISELCRLSCTYTCTRSSTWLHEYSLIFINYRPKNYPCSWYCQSKQLGHFVQAACSKNTAAWTEIILCISGKTRCMAKFLRCVRSIRVHSFWCRIRCRIRCRKYRVTS